MKVHTYERLFLTLGAVLLVACVAALVYASTALHMHLPGNAGRIDPATAYSTPPFDHPGVHQTGPNAYDVVVVAQAWAFMPAEIHVPAGADVTFIGTSADIIHGFYIEATRVNMMLIPGQISRMQYRFPQAGVQKLLLCHEYCGLGHHTMSAKVIVDPPTPTAATTAAATAGADAPVADAPSTAAPSTPMHGEHAL